MDTPKKQQPCDPDLLHPGVQADLHKYLETAVCGSKETRTFSAALLSDLFGFDVAEYPGTGQHGYVTVNGFVCEKSVAIDVLFYCAQRGTYRALTLDAVNAAVEVLTRTVQELFQETGVVSRSVYSAFAAYRVCQKLYNNSQRDISPLESYAGQIVTTFIMGGAKIENALMPR